MKEYVATFWTHLSAISTLRALKAAGVQADARPVPRALSASCGTCVRYLADEQHEACLHRDYETVYAHANGEYYEAVLSNDAPV